ncbi:MAG: DUF4012 domain-containing protein [Acidimicrobiales bacterium]
MGFLFLLILAYDLYRIRDDLAAGERSLDGLTLDAAASVGLAGFAEDASSHLVDADRRARTSLPLRALSVLPAVGEQVAGVRNLTGATALLGRTGAEAARNIDSELEGAGKPAGRIALLDTTLAELDRIDATLADLDLGEGDDLVGPLRGAHDDLVGTIGRAREKLDEGRALVAPVREMLAGPTTFLLLAANNAEMAGGAGLTLSAGFLTFDGGEIELGEVVRAGDLRLDRAVDLPGDISEIYSPTGVGIDLRSTTRSPHLPTMGPVVAEMMETYDVEDLDGVLIVDAVALADVMALTGDVEVEGRTITADNVLAEVLNENYKEFESFREREERVDYQGEIAKEIFESITTLDIPAAELAQVLLTSSQGRHLMLWSADDDLQAVWSELQIAGELSELGLMISFQNYAANKLDWYLRPEADLDVRLLPSGDYRAHLTMRMDAPPLAELTDASPYILGPGPDTQGTFLTVHLPAAAYDITTPNPDGFRTKGVDGGLQVRTFLTDVPMGTTFERSLDFSLPRSVGAMLLLPSARIEPLPLTVDGTVTVTDDEPVAISWLAAGPPPASEAGAPLAVRVLVLLGLALSAAAAVATAVAVRRRAGDGVADVAFWRSTAQLSVALMAISFATAGLVALMLAAPRV